VRGSKKKLAMAASSTGEGTGVDYLWGNIKRGHLVEIKLKGQKRGVLQRFGCAGPLVWCYYKILGDVPGAGAGGGKK